MVALSALRSMEELSTPAFYDCLLPGKKMKSNELNAEQDEKHVRGTYTEVWIVILLLPLSSNLKYFLLIDAMRGP